MGYHSRPCVTGDVAPDSALAAIRSFEGPVLVDLDETLYLRNSTEDFIDSAVPGVIALILMRVLDVLKPWGVTGGPVTRDAWRVGTIVFFFPWVLIRWKLRAPVLAASNLNRPLLGALMDSSGQRSIVTSGLHFIVTPLLEALEFGNVPLVAARGLGFKDRRRGKLGMAVAALGIEVVKRALVVTDSEQDRALLDACAMPVRTLWPQARFHQALSRVYLPGEYVSRIKRPGERYILRGILQEDFAFWVLCSGSLAVFPLQHVAGLLLLLLSFWSIYERGYVDNDFVAAQFEEDPKLSAEFRSLAVARPRWRPWIWAILSGALAVYMLCGPFHPRPVDFVAWFLLLAATHGWFKLYNRVDKGTRIWMYPFLQLSRTAAFAVLVPVVPIGAVVIGAQVLARWVPYYSYRISKNKWPNAHTHTIRLLFIIVLIAPWMLVWGITAVFTWTAAVIFLWTAFRARHEVMAMVRAASRLDGEKRQGPRVG